jgi:hypothetical protein
VIPHPSSISVFVPVASVLLVFLAFPILITQPTAKGLSKLPRVCGKEGSSAYRWHCGLAACVAGFEEGGRQGSRGVEGDQNSLWRKRVYFALAFELGGILDLGGERRELKMNTLKDTLKVGEKW